MNRLKTIMLFFLLLFPAAPTAAGRGLMVWHPAETADATSVFVISARKPIDSSSIANAEGLLILEMSVDSLLIPISDAKVSKIASEVLACHSEASAAAAAFCNKAAKISGSKHFLLADPDNIFIVGNGAIQKVPRPVSSPAQGRLTLSHLLSDSLMDGRYVIVAQLDSWRHAPLKALLMTRVGKWASLPMWLPVFSAARLTPTQTRAIDRTASRVVGRIRSGQTTAADVARVSSAINDSISVDLRVAFEQFPEFDMPDRLELVQELSDIWAQKAISNLNSLTQ